MSRKVEPPAALCEYHSTQLRRLGVLLPCDNVADKVAAGRIETVDSFWTDKEHKLIHYPEQLNGQGVCAQVSRQSASYVTQMLDKSRVSSSYKQHSIQQLHSQLPYAEFLKESTCGCYSNTCSQCWRLTQWQRLNVFYKAKWSELQSCVLCRYNNVAEKCRSRQPLCKEQSDPGFDYEVRASLHSFIRTSGVPLPLPPLSMRRTNRTDLQYTLPLAAMGGGSDQGYQRQYKSKNDGVLQAFFLYPRAQDRVSQREQLSSMYMHLVPVQDKEIWDLSDGSILTEDKTEVCPWPYDVLLSDNTTQTTHVSRIPTLESLMQRYTTHRQPNFTSTATKSTPFHWNPQMSGANVYTRHECAYKDLFLTHSPHICSYQSGQQQDCFKCSGVHGVQIEPEKFHNKVAFDGDVQFYEQIDYEDDEDYDWWRYTRRASLFAVRQRALAAAQDALAAELDDCADPMAVLGHDAVMAVVEAKKQPWTESSIQVARTRSSYVLRYIYGAQRYANGGAIPLVWLLPYFSTLPSDILCTMLENLPIFDSHEYAGLWQAYILKRSPQSSPMHNDVADLARSVQFPYLSLVKQRKVDEFKRKALVRTLASEAAVKDERRVKTVKIVGTVGPLELGTYEPKRPRVTTTPTAHNVLDRVLLDVKKQSHQERKTDVFVQRAQRITAERSLRGVYCDCEWAAGQQRGLSEEDLTETKRLLAWPDFSAECKPVMDRHDLNRIWTTANRFECADDRLRDMLNVMKDITKQTLVDLKKHIDKQGSSK